MAYSAPVGEKCEMAFSFHIRYFPVTYSPFVAFCWSLMRGVVYGLLLTLCQYQVRCQKLTGVLQEESVK